MELERASIADRLATERIVEGPCKDNEHGCLQGLSDLLSDGAAFQEVQCAKEALPANNAGKPELALSLCQLREDARLTIRVLQFGRRMGRFE